MYQNTKAFNLAKALGYKYLLRLECDAVYSEENVKDIKEKIKECVESGKKAVFLCENLTTGHPFLRMNMSFWKIDWYLEKIGNIKNEKEWRDFLNRYGFDEGTIEDIFYKVFIEFKEDFLNYDKPLPHYLKTLKYKETERFYKSDAIIDFFKGGETLFFCALNHNQDSFPSKLVLKQYLENDRFLTNTISDPGSSLIWIVVDCNVKNVDLMIDGVTHKIDKIELFSTKNVVIFQ
jgi:hypothetical protein